MTLSIDSSSKRQQERGRHGHEDETADYSWVTDLSCWWSAPSQQRHQHATNAPNMQEGDHHRCCEQQDRLAGGVLHRPATGCAGGGAV
jgi:hypothetical protein